MKGLKKFIWDKLDKGECVLDQDIAEFVGKGNDVNFSMVEYYKNQWISFNNTKEYLLIFFILIIFYWLPIFLTAFDFLFSPVTLNA